MVQLADSAGVASGSIEQPEIAVPLAVKVIVPDGVIGESCPASVAVRVTAWLTVDEAFESASETVAAEALTVSVAVAGFATVKFGSPA